MPSQWQTTLGYTSGHSNTDRPFKKFCVSDSRQNQEYHILNMQDERLFLMPKFSLLVVPVYISQSDMNTGRSIRHRESRIQKHLI